MKGLAAVVVAVVVASSAAAVVVPEHVVKMNVEDEGTSAFEYILNPRQADARSRLGKYVFKNCGNPKSDLANISSLTFGPDPIVFPGDITVSFNIDIHRTLDAPLKGSFTLSKQVSGNWIKIPCIGSIGSCEYQDVCDLLKNVDCPPPFNARNIPCKCPFTKGSYSLPTSQFQVDVPVFPAGDYHALGKLTYQGLQVACVDIYASFG